MRGFYFYVMFKRYFLVSFLGGLIGAGCVLIVVYVTNTKALVISEHDPDTAVSSLHSRINDFYIFAGIAITLLLVINVGVFVKADAEVDQQIKTTFGKHEEDILQLIEDLREITSREEKNKKTQKMMNKKYILNYEVICELKQRVCGMTLLLPISN